MFSVSSSRLPFALALAFSVLPALAHEGHDHGPSLGDEAAATGPVTLTPEARKNLGLETVEVEIGTIQKTVALLARVERIPEKSAQLSARVDGQVTAILVRLGQSVQKGDPLIEIEPLTIDSPSIVLNSPINGVVTAQHTALGMSVNAGTVLVELADLREVLVRGIAYENADLAAVDIGTPVTVKLDFFRNETFSAVVERIAPTLNPETRTFEIYALLENPDLRIKPNLQGTMLVGVGEEQIGVSVPSRAVLGSLGNLFVFVEAAENSFERRAVTLGIRMGDHVEILEGVLPGERVVVRGNYQLQFASPEPPTETAQPGGDAAVHTHADGTIHHH